MTEQRWTVEQANTWYANLPWLVGCNFIPSSAINQLEMWQADTFDPQTLQRERPRPLASPWPVPPGDFLDPIEN